MNAITEEQVDIITEQNEVIRTSPKSLAHTEGLLHRIVIGEIVNSKGKYCFVKQAGDRQDPGQFVSPIGGHVSAGESPDDALVRECQEECGFIPTNFKFLTQSIYNREVIGRIENHLFLIYQINSDENPILNHESVEFLWFSKEEIAAALSSHDQGFGAAWHHVFQLLKSHH